MISVSDDLWINEQAVRRLPTVEMQLLAWIRLLEAQRISRCMDLRRGGYRLYVRRSKRELPGVADDARALDIASVALSPKLRSKGWFRCFLELVDALNPWEATYVECVHNPRLAQYLARSGYALDGTCSYYRPSQRWRARHQALILTPAQCGVTSLVF